MKITGFMRVTKQPKVHGKIVDTSPIVRKQQARGAEQSDEESGAHIPTFIYETVKYKHSHLKHDVSKETKIVIKYIKQYYDVPKDFEQNAKFGCYSGLTHEKRVMRAYSMGQLPRKCSRQGGAAPAPICLTCAMVGHTYKNCPEGF